MKKKFIGGGIICCLLLTLCGCKTRYVTQELPVEIHDTIYKVSTHSKVDTLWRKDSISVIDTMWVDTSTIATLGMPTLHHNRTTIANSNQGKVSVQQRVDTVLRVKETPVTLTKVETKEANKLHWWQKVLMWIGCVAFAYFIYKLKKIF